MSFLNALNNKDKIEILLNAYCSPTCQRRLEHYDYLSMEQIGIHNNDFNCPCMENSFFDALKYESVIKKDELYRKFKDMGFSNFKIEGRSNHIVDVIDSYVYYMVKDEYKDRVRNILLKNVFLINPNFVSNILSSIFNI